MKAAQRSNPSGRWWIKADACDVQKGLMESLKGEWSGDEDLGSKELAKLHNEYRSRCNAIQSFGIHSTTADLDKLRQELTTDVKFLEEGEVKAKAEYSSAVDAKRHVEATLMELSWDVVGYEELLKKARKYITTVTALEESSSLTTILKVLCPLKNEYQEYLKGVYSKKRSAATHLMIFMIADECRNRKPYAVPVRFLSYKSITDKKLRELELEVEKAMKKLGMIVVGNYNFNENKIGLMI